MKYFEKGNIVIYPEHERITLSGVIGPQEQMALSGVLVHFQGKKVQLFIDSKGGSFSSGLFMHDAVRLHGEVTGVVTAEAHSSAFMIFQSCSERLMYPRSEIMLHAPTEALRVDQKNVLEKANKTLKEYYSFLRFLSKKTKLKIGTLKDWSGKERKFSAQEALENNLADSIIEKLPRLNR